MDTTLTIYSPEKKPTQAEKDDIADFLYKHLDQFGDPREQIMSAIDFALKEYESFGGMILRATIGNEIVGAVVLNKTGMKGYIPDNILVYIAVHCNYRGKKIGRYLMEQAIENTEGDMKLHVEHDNPARFLYQKVGFTNKYLEMRYQRGDK